MLQKGMILDDTYVIESLIGSGGGGIVYRAYHKRLKTDVVVKQIKENVKGILESRTEVDILKNIKHTYLPRVYDFLEINNQIYTVMDYVSGESLDKIIERQGSFQAKLVYQWAVQLAEALAYLHQQTPPIIHSDIKPSNIMLTPKGDICLIDFNISLAFQQNMKTSTGISRGYSPPEQYGDYRSYRIKVQQSMEQNCEVQQNSATELMTQFPNQEKQTPTAETESLISAVAGRGVDERSDIYSLGATLYHLLTGVHPSQDFTQFIPLRCFDMEISEGFLLIMNKMLELNPEQRYQNGQELLNALQHIYELDSEYQKYQRIKLRRRILIGVLYAAGIACVTAGVNLRGKEKIADYNAGVERADYYIASGDFDDAERSIRDAMGIFPNGIGVHEKEILRLFRMGQYEDCITYAYQIVNNPLIEIKTDSDKKISGDIFYILGNSYFEQEDYINAAASLKTAIEKCPQNNLYFRDYAIVLAKNGNVDGAEKQLEKATSLGLGEDSISFAQGEISYARESYIQAAQYFRDSISVTNNPELRGRAVLLCAFSYKKLGNDYLDQELELLENETRENGVEISMHVSEQLADAYTRKAQTDAGNSGVYYEKALQLFQDLYNRGYATRQIMENIAIIYQQQGEFEQAEQTLFQLTDQYPDDYRGYKRLSFLEADKQQHLANESRNYARMRDYYNKAVALYQKQGTEDTEMFMVQKVMEDLQRGGWFQ